MPVLLYYSASSRRTGPVLVCDECGERIENIREANVLWDAELLSDAEPMSAFLVAHKGTCTKLLDREAGKQLSWNEGSLFIFQLVSNVGLTAADFEELGHRQFLLEGL